jgi:hypothetical protein
LLRLIKNHNAQGALEKVQHEKLLAAVEAQAKDIRELRATIEGQAAEIAKLTPASRPTGPGGPTYSDALRRTSSASSDSGTTLVSDPDAMKGLKNGGLKDDQMDITVNTKGVKKNKQDTAVMQEILNRSLRTFKVTEEKAIECIRLRQTDSVDLVFASEEDRDKARTHPE